jgi:hypothetical protein
MLFEKINFNCFVTPVTHFKVGLLFTLLQLVEIVARNFDYLCAGGTISQHCAVYNIMQVKLFVVGEISRLYSTELTAFLLSNYCNSVDRLGVFLGHCNILQCPVLRRWRL